MFKRTLASLGSMQGDLIKIQRLLCSFQHALKDTSSQMSEPERILRVLDLEGPSPWHSLWNAQ